MVMTHKDCQRFTKSIVRELDKNIVMTHKDSQIFPNLYWGGWINIGWWHIRIVKDCPNLCWWVKKNDDTKGMSMIPRMYTGGLDKHMVMTPQDSQRFSKCILVGWINTWWWHPMSVKDSPNVIICMCMDVYIYVYIYNNINIYMSLLYIYVWLHIYI